MWLQKLAFVNQLCAGFIARDETDCILCFLTRFRDTHRCSACSATVLGKMSLDYGVCCIYILSTDFVEARALYHVM